MIDGVQMSAYSVTSARVPIKPIRFGNEGVDALLSRKQFHSFLKLDLHASGSLAATKAFLATGLCGCVGIGVLSIIDCACVINTVHTTDPDRDCTPLCVQVPRMPYGLHTDTSLF